MGKVFPDHPNYFPRLFAVAQARNPGGGSFLNSPGLLPPLSIFPSSVTST